MMAAYVLMKGFLVLLLFGFYAQAQIYKCDFEKNTICTFLENSIKNKENWKLGQGKVNSNNTGPSVDHTYGNSTGRYIYVNVTAVGRSEVTLQTLILKADYCLKFWYHMYGADVGSLSVRSEAEKVTQNNLIFFRSGSQGDRWKQVVFSVNRTQLMKQNGYRVTFIAKHFSRSKVRGDIALDDVELNRGACPSATKKSTELCTFDDDNCGYQAKDRSAELNWEWKGYGTDISFLQSNPQLDHTLGTNVGGYWLVATDTADKLETVVLSSPVYAKPKDFTSCCVHFYYYMDADAKGGQLWWSYEVKEAYVQAYLTYSADSKTLMMTKAKNSTKHRVWTYAEAQGDIYNKFQIEFLAGMQTDTAASIALDDVKVVKGLCPEAGFCDFEQDKCTWSDGEGDIIWLRKSGSTLTNDVIGPEKDNTLETSEGNYLVVSTKYKDVGVKAVLESEVFPPNTAPSCVTFFYYMSGDDVGTLKVLGREENATETTLWLINDHQADMWMSASAPMSSSKISTQIVFQGITGKAKSGVMALDDIRIRVGDECVLKPTAADPKYEAVKRLSCTFDDLTLCNWKQPANTLQWQFGNVSLVDSTGPKEPLNGKGHHIFVSADTDTNHDLMAKLESPVVSSFYPDAACFSFFYYMFGAHVGELRVISVTGVNSNAAVNRKVIWRRAGTQPDKWIHFQETLNMSYGDFKIEIEADGGVGFAGAIALDEVVMSLTKCENKKTCDFERSTCGWTIQASRNKKFYWNRGANQANGPSADHTTSSDTGSYLQAVATPDAGLEEETRLISPQYSQSLGAHCFSFWYYRPGLSVGKISVYDRVQGVNGDNPLWSVTSDMGKFWHYAQVNLDYTKKFQVIIHAEKGENNDYQMAVDDLNFENGPCKSAANCDFNKDYCSYYLNDTSNFSWLLGTGRTVNTQLVDQPPQDNSVDKGMYIYTDMTSPSLKEGQEAVLVSEVLMIPSTKVTCVSFYLHINGEDTSNFSVGAMDINNEESDMRYVVVDRYGLNEATGPGWTKTDVNIPGTVGQLFQFYLKAVRGKGPRGFIAVDDISVTEGLCSVGPGTTETPPVTDMPENSLTCNFDKGDLCSWKTSKDKLKWTVNERNKATGSMPKFDHTIGNYNGRYSYVSGDDVSTKRGSLISPVIPKEFKGKFCFGMWYWVNTQGKSSMTVSVLDVAKQNVVSSVKWHSEGNFGYKWRHDYISMSSSHSSPTVNITGRLKSGTIAIDDLGAMAGSCPPTKMCTFDGGVMCNMVQDASNNLFWDVKYGNDADVIYQMPDHTTNSLYGNFLYIGFNGSTTSPSERSRIFTPKRKALPSSSCVTFYYHINNPNKVSLNTYLSTDNGVADPLWSVYMSQGLLWHGARFTVPSTTLSWQVIFEAVVGSRGYGQIGLDDISITNGACPSPGFCDFEQDNCLWEDARTPYQEPLQPAIRDTNRLNSRIPESNAPVYYILQDDFDWTRHIGEDYFGPPSDHTLGNPQGFYLILNPPSLSPSVQKAVYVSERLRASPSVCLKFWYAIPVYKNGAQLHVYVSSDFDSADQVTALKDSTDEKWTQFMVTVTPIIRNDNPVRDFWLFLVGTVGNNSLSYVAVDDISVQSGYCETVAELFDCKNGQHVLQTDVCDFHTDCSNGLDEASCADCDFESNSCGWAPSVSTSNLPFKWVRSRAGRENLPYDHTKNDASGYFMIAAGTDSNWNPNKYTSLESADLRNSFSTCSLQFWYNIIGNVSVTVVLRRNEAKIELWKPFEASPHLWTQAEVLLGRIPQQFQIAIELNRDTRVQTHVAIDDVETAGCDIGSIVPVVCSSDQFSCKNSRCISMDSVCDYTDDCGNYEDERQETCVSALSRCHFDQSFCDWIQEGDTSLRWIQREPFPTIDLGPTRDHTTGTTSGKFLYLPGRLNPSPARLLGPLLQPAENCQIRFYYDIRGNGALSLQIKTRTESNGDEKVVWTREDATDSLYFVNERVTFDEQQSFQVIIEGQVTTAGGRVNYIALDDVSFSYKCVPHTTILPTLPPTLTTATPSIVCKKGEFLCKTSRQCINQTKVCDFKSDCVDNSDENNCGSCDFDKDMCGLVNIGVWTSYIWKRQHAEAFGTSVNTTIPTSDSHGNTEGYFAVLSGKPSGGFNDPAIMRTPAFKATSHSCKLEFHYHFNVRGGSLEVYINRINYGSYGRELRFSQKSNTGKNWQFASVPIGNYPAGRVIEFHGSVKQQVSAGKLQDIAVDNINYVNCDPQETFLESLNCTFDDDECGWHPDNDFTRALWSRTRSLYLGPSSDHTGKKGYFMYIESSNYFVKGDKAHLVSLRQRPSERCMTLWYHMFGQDVGTLNLIIRTDSSNYTIWSKTNSQGNAWKQGMRTIRSDEPYSIVIEGIVGSFASPIIAIDDVFLYEEPCPHPVACDFEADFCDWTPNGWVRKIGKGNKPSKDHSTNTGTGRYAALNEPIGFLRSPSINASRDGHCVDFWYFLEGNRDTNLKLLKQSDGAQGVIVWVDVAQPEVKGQWDHSRASVTDMPAGQFSVVFNGTNPGDNGVMAIDDVSVEEGACPPIGSCNFEKDLCTWKNLKKPISSGLNWIRNSGGTRSIGTGPVVDVTTGTSDGWYIYLDGNYAYSGQTAVLESELLHYTPSACFKFWYHMYGRGQGYIEVQYVNHADSKITMVKRISGNQGNKWFGAKLLVKDLPGTYKIRLVGSIGWSGSDIAIDDVFIREDTTCDEVITTLPPPTQFPPTDFDCDFEVGDFCNWASGDAWVVQQGRRAVTNQKGPLSDHTLGNALGRYAYYNPLNDSGHELISPTIDTENSDYCFRFWYYMHSSFPISLKLYAMQNNHVAGPLWMKKTSAGTKWKYGTFYFKQSVNTTITMKGEKKLSQLGDIAVDDISFNRGSCPIMRGIPCDFESTDICGYKVESPHGISWKRSQAKLSKTGPQTDKTYGTNEGHYMMVAASSSATIPGDNMAYLVLPNLPSTGSIPTCVRFWYQMKGTNVVALKLYMRTPRGSLPQFHLWAHTSRHADTWRVGQTTVEAPYVHEVVFEAVTERGNDGFIALDEVVIKEGVCPPPASCDFEEDLCTWQNSDDNVDLEWIRNAGSTPTKNTGPDTDHTEKTALGSYVYLQAANPEGRRNLVGILQSEYLSQASDRCLSFWAHMRGVDMGSLSVNLTYYSHDQKFTIANSPWTIEGDQGSNWFNRQINLNMSWLDVEDEYQISFVGKTKGELSDIALDDIDVSDTICYEVPDEGFDCRDGTHVNSSAVCDFNRDCASGEDEVMCGQCDFEHGYCNWRELTSSYYRKWVRVQGADDKRTNGPGYDHTSNSSAGYFVIVDSSNAYGYHESTLQSPGELYKYKKSYSSCVMQFYYAHKEGSKAYIRVVKRLGTYTVGTVWEQYGTKDSGWQLGRAYLGTTEQPFYIEFVHQSSYEQTYVAIDDVSFEGCGLPEKKNRCSNREFQCSNGRCVSRYTVCDLTDDCGDRSDENPDECSKYPMSCTFELSTDCEWAVKGKSKNFWKIETASSSRGRKNSGPIVDHSKGINFAGRYLTLKRSNSELKSNQSLYVSPNYKLGGESYCTLRFYYYMYGDDIKHLKVYSEFEHEGWTWTQLFTKVGSIGQMWNRAVVNVRDTRPFHFIIEGNIGETSESVIAIDDISLSTGCKPYTGDLPTPIPTPLPTRSVCTDQQFKCETGQPLCIPIAKACDFTRDCADGSDEKECGPCNFDTDCGYEDDSAGMYEWARKNASDASDFGPLVDRKNSTEGWYAYVKRSRGFYIEPAYLLTPSLPATSSHCVMSFWVYYSGTSKSVFVDYKAPTKFSNYYRRLWTSPSTLNPKWILKELRVPQSKDKGSSIRFGSSPNWSNVQARRDIAIAEVNFLNCNPKELLADCNFDDGFCFWTQTNYDALKWLRTNGSTYLNFTGPTSDHTTGHGYYAYINNIRGGRYQTATLRSPLFPMNAPSGSCFSFWYHMYGNHIGSLRVETADGTWVTNAWYKSGTQGNKWLHGEVNLNFTTDFRVNIKAVTVWGLQNNIAIDDVKMVDGSCPSTTTCDFEVDFCGWISNFEGLSAWKRTQGSGNFTGEKPSVDHTTNSEQGYFIYFPSVRPGDFARIESPLYKNYGDICLKFWYNMYGNDIGTLAVYQRTLEATRLDNLKTQWKRSGNHGGSWKLGRVSLKALPSYFIAIEAQMGNNPSGYIALDDIEVVHGSCSDPGSCTFEIDSCGWSQHGIQTDIDWVRRTGHDQNMGGGPTYDRSTRNSQGHYMYAYLKGQPSNSQCTLLSEDLEIYPNYCISLWYNMYNSLNTSFAVDRISVGSDILGVIDLKSWDLENNTWAQVETNVSVPSIGDFFNLAITVTTLVDQDNDTDRGVAIDNVSLRKHTCGQDILTTPTPISTTTPYPSTKYDCDFENGLCMWENELGEYWIVLSGHSDKTLTRPRTDHTTKSTGGHYLTSNSTKFGYNLNRLVSQDGIEGNSDGVCFKFWYHMYGNNPGSLFLKVRHFHDETYETVWFRRGSGGPTWLYEQVHIVKSYDFKLVFHSDTTRQGTISLDDFSLNYKNCPPRDYCDVELDYCGFSHDPSADFQWQRGNGSKTSGPEIDHTYGSSTGNYFYVDSQKPIKEGQVARLESGPYQPDRKCMQFWYYLDGVDVGSLEVLVNDGENKQTMWRETGDYSESWHGSEVIVNKTLFDSYSYIFQVTAGPAFSNGTVAIDDIVVRDSCPPLGSCNFEDGLCLWTNAPDADLQWLRGSGEISNAAPENDVTFGTQFGVYAYVHIVYDWKNNPKPAQLISPFFSSVKTRCINYWNFRNGTDFSGILSVSLFDDDTDDIMTLQMFTKEKLGRWQNAQVEVNREENAGKYQIIFEADMTTRVNEFIALDDISVYEGSCVPITDRKLEFTCDKGITYIDDDRRCDFFQDCKDNLDESSCGTFCDFEEEEPEPCNWRSISTPAATWKQVKANATNTPPMDHSKNTPGDGRFMQFQYLQRWVYDGTADIKSPALIQSSSTCRMYFWYYSTTIYSNEYLSVYYDSSHQSKQTRLFYLAGAHEKSWQLAEVVVGRILNRFEVGIRARKRSSTAVFAVDDITFEDCPILRPTENRTTCKEDEFLCQNGNCISSDLVCDFADDCGDYSDENLLIARCDSYPGRCDFENGICDWKRADETDFSWTRTQSNSGPYNYYSSVPPSRDHTTNSASGFFLFFSNLYRQKGHVARVASKVMETADSSCKLRFFYTYGAEYSTTKYDEMQYVGSLTVYVRKDEVNAWDPVLIVKEPPGQYYEKAIVPLGDLKDPFEIIIEAKIDDTIKRGGWAVDDVSFTPGCIVSNRSLPLTFIEPSKEPPDQICNETQFKCTEDKICIDADKVCDFVPDCPDSSDEAKCGTCNFDDDSNPVCGWKDVKDNKWRRQKGKRGENGLTSDVSGNGYYMYVEKLNSGTIGSEAILHSVDFQDAYATCEISFYYFMSGIENSDESLRLQLQTSKRQDVTLWSERSDQGNRWQNVTASIGQREKGWHLNFIATHVRSKGDVAIDEINLIKCAPPEKRKCANIDEFACLSGECVNKSLVCDFSNDCPDGSDEANCLNFLERCDFESGTFCGWSQDKSAKLKWVLASGREINDGEGPDRDHTTGEETGHFLITTKKDYSYSTSKMKSTLFKADTSGKCKIRLWHHLFRNSRSSIIVNTLIEGDTRLKEIEGIEGSKGDEWSRIEVTLNSLFNFHVVIEGVAVAGSKGAVAIDDLSFTPECIPMYTIITTPIPTVQPTGTCEKKGEFTCDDNSCVPFDVVCDFKTDCPHGRDEKNCPAFCDFEKGSTCGWYAVTKEGDGVEMVVTTAEKALKISSYAPEVDKSTNTKDGSFLMIHTNLVSAAGPIDTYRSPSFSASAATCKFQFWFATHFIYDLESRVSISTMDQDIDLVQFPYATTRTWRRMESGIGRRTHNFTISVYKKGVLGRQDFIMIDDIEFVNCALPQKSLGRCIGFKCDNAVCIDDSRVCDLTDDCGDGSDEKKCAGRYLQANFEDGFGIFRQVKNDPRAPLSWTLNKGTADAHFTLRTGPAFDHTLSGLEGQYLAFTKAPGETFDQTAWVASEVMWNAYGNDCEMRFYYFMYGAKVRQLNIYSRINADGDLNHKWSQTGEVGNFWMRGTVTFNETKPFEVIIEGKAGVTFADFIAVDDISFTPKCELLKDASLPTTAVTGAISTTTMVPSDCKPDEFFCVKDKVCISGEKRCDFRVDCKDKTDEAGCVQSTCNFENGDLCGWSVYHKLKNFTRVKRQADDGSVYKWIAIQAKDKHSQVNMEFRPVKDHTSDSKEGWYLLADGAPGVANDVTSIMTPKISATHSRCALDFWLYCGQYTCNLRVYTNEGDDIQSSEYIWRAQDAAYDMFPGKWIHAMTHLGPRSNYRVRFEATRPTNYNNVICLDGISFSECPPAPKQKCASNQIQCANKRCVNRTLLCDYNNDCGDNTDEMSYICSAYKSRCDFEHTVCNWHLEPDGEVHWGNQAVDGSVTNVPSTDHTTRSSIGMVLVATSNVFTLKKKPVVRSETIEGNAVNCTLRLWYNLYGPQKLLVYKRTNYNDIMLPGKHLVQELSSNAQKFWHRAEILLDNKGIDFQVLLEANFGDFPGSVSIDDVSMTPSCKIATDRDIPGLITVAPNIDDCYPEKFTCETSKKCYTHLQKCNFIDDCGDNSDEADCGTSCDFEGKSTCGWYSVKGAQFKWIIQRANKTYRINADHTLQTEYGSYITRNTVQQGQVADLHTKAYVISGGDCEFVFWYYFNYTEGGEELSVVLRSSQKDHDAFKELWKVTKDQGAQWNKATVPIGTQEYFSIILKSIRGWGYKGAVAVDDIMFQKCASNVPPTECTSDEWTCTDQPQCVKIWQHCDGKDDCIDKSDEFKCIPQPGDCNFNSDNWMDECEWSSKKLAFEWSRGNHSLSDETGPPRNHNPRDEGYYLYIDSSKQNPGELAGVATPTFKPSEGKCHLRFWYYMKGSPSMGRLEVFSEEEGGDAFLVWNERGPQKEEWLFGHSLLGSRNRFKVVFIAERGGDNLTDIAIDDVSFTSSCAEGGDLVVPTGRTCYKDEFRCKSGTCIPKAWRCDCASDCQDGSDEDGCDITCSSTGAPKTEPTTPYVTVTAETQLPQKNCKEGEKLCGDEKTCIPGLLLCDGVDDCADGSDERGCSGAKLCKPNFYFCKDKKNPPCLHREKICNRVKDCSDGSDESICDECPKDFCKNNGSCSVVKRALVCYCPPEFAANRCGRTIATPDREKDTYYATSGAGWIAGVVIGTLLLVAILVIIWYKRNTNAERTRLAHAVDNPVYGLNLDTLTFGDLNAHMPVRNDDGATAVENPLYAFKSDSK